MRYTRGRSGAAGTPRRLNVVRIKLIIVAIGAGFCAILSSLTGITPQAPFVPMLGWMLGFSAAKSQATAMRVTAGTAIACVAGALWRSSLTAFAAPVAEHRITILHSALVSPSRVAIIVCALFVGATIGAVLASKAAPRPEMVGLRRGFLFSGVCIGLYVAMDGVHYSTLVETRAAMLTGGAGFLVLGTLSGALTQILGLASGVILVPFLLYFAALSIQQAILLSLSVIGLAALLPAWSYNRRGLGDSQYGTAGIVGGIGFGLVGGAILATAPSKLLLMLFGLMAMFFSAREISIIALTPTNSSSPLDPSKPSGPGLG